MASFLWTLLIIFVVFGLSFLLINIRHLVLGEEFRGTCSSNNPMLQKEVGSCTMCGRQTGEPCGNPGLSGSDKE